MGGKSSITRSCTIDHKCRTIKLLGDDVPIKGKAVFEDNRKPKTEPLKIIYREERRIDRSDVERLRLEQEKVAKAYKYLKYLYAGVPVIYIITILWGS